MKRKYNWKMMSITGVLGLIVLVVVILLINGKKDIVTVEAKVDTLTRTIDLTGKVVPAEEVDLGFSTGGRINSINVRDGQRVSRGDVLATLDSSEVDASLRQAIAERGVSENESTSLSGKLGAQKRDAYNAIQKAFNVSVTQIKSNTDTLISDPQSTKLKFKYTIRQFSLQQSITQKRIDIGKMLEEWTVEVSKLNSSNVQVEDLQNASKNLNEISGYLREVATSLSEAEAVGSVSDADLSEYKIIVTNARTAIDGVINDVSNAQENLRDTDSALPIQQAKINAASATIDKFSAQINNYTISAPFDGVVVDVSAIVGETVSSNIPVVSLINNSTVEVEVFVPEIYMRDLNVNDSARIKIEALGDDVALGATVVYVEGRGVERNGIVTYKTTLALAIDSPDIKSGMTALIEIDTLIVEGLLLIPRSAVEVTDKIITDANNINAKVKVLENGKVNEKEIVVGRNDSSGMIEVVSGLSVGERVVVSSVE